MMRYLISIGAGLAAAIFFIVPMKGAMAAGVTMLFAPLPLMIAGMAFAPSSALTGGLAGALLIWALVHEYYAVFFLAWAAFPAFWLTRLAWLARPAGEGESAEEDGLVWYPVGGLVFWSALLGAGVSAGLVLAGVIWLGGYDAFLSQTIRSLTPILEMVLKAPSGPKLPEGASVGDLARYAALAIPAVLAAWATLSYAANLWIAGRVTQMSHVMKRPWLAIPEHLRMPQTATFFFSAAFLLCVLTGLPRALGLIGLAALGIAYALQGFAILHAMSRGFQWRNALLLPLYFATFFLFPAPVVLVALFGLAHALTAGARRGQRNSGTPNP